MSQTHNTQNTSTKLTGTQLVVLSRAAQHEAGAATPPERISAKAAQKMAATLVERKLVRKVKALADKPVWMQEEGGAVALVITKLGRAAINAPEETEAPKVEGNAAVVSDPLELVVPVASTIRTPRDGTKLSLLIEMLARETGASIEDLVAATGWLPHTTRAALTGLRKRGYTIERMRVDDAGPSFYHLADVAAPPLAA